MGSEPVPQGFASRDPPSLSRLIGHMPYIARHGVEPLVGVSELRRQSLGLDGTDQQSELTCLLVKKAVRLKALASRGVMYGRWPDASWTVLRPRLRLHPSENWKPFSLRSAQGRRGLSRVLYGAGPGKRDPSARASRHTMIPAREGSRQRRRAAKKLSSQSPIILYLPYDQIGGRFSIAPRCASGSGRGWPGLSPD
jgi:hypothetical protein